jgi:predicted DNA-binding protein
MPKGHTDRPRRTSPHTGTPSVQIAVYMEPDFLARLDALADDEGRSRSQMSRRLMERGMTREAAAA